MKRSLVIGHQGQDGRILVERLRSQGGEVLGLSRGEVDLTDAQAVAARLASDLPDVIYYLAAFHHSAEEEITLSDAEIFHRSFETHVFGPIAVLEAMRGRCPGAQFFYAASSHVFGTPEVEPQSETTPMNPTNIYGISKTAGIHACRYYRRVHRLFASCGILYNHESPWRKPKFVSQKIIQGAREIAAGRRSSLTLGNLEAEADWGHAEDYVEAMIRIMDLAEPDDFVVATGESHSVREFARIAFDTLNLDADAHIKVDGSLLHKPSTRLVGDSSRLRARTGWEPSLKFPDMVRSLFGDRP
jgi:GDPmannose 4,6-dehydratase